MIIETRLVYHGYPIPEEKRSFGISKEILKVLDKQESQHMQSGWRMQQIITSRILSSASRKIRVTNFHIIQQGSILILTFRVPLTPASSKVSRQAASLAVSSISHPPCRSKYITQETCNDLSNSPTEL